MLFRKVQILEIYIYICINTDQAICSASYGAVAAAAHSATTAIQAGVHVLRELQASLGADAGGARGYWY
jgi:hypothetical protein